MKKVSILLFVILIIALVGTQVVGNETNQLVKEEDNEIKAEQKSETSVKTTSVTITKSESKEGKSKDSKEVETVRIRMENGYKNSLNNLENFKENLKKQKVKIVLTHNNKEFAKGYIGLNEQRDGLKFIYFVHTEHQEKPEYVKKYNRFRKETYSVKY